MVLHWRANALKLRDKESDNEADVLSAPCQSKFLHLVILQIIFQDFEDWDDVGLNIAKPPDLLHLYRDYAHHTVPDVMLVLQSVKEEKANLEAEHAKLQENCKKLQEEIGELRYENHVLAESIEKLER